MGGGGRAGAEARPEGGEGREGRCNEHDLWGGRLAVGAQWWQRTAVNAPKAGGAVALAVVASATVVAIVEARGQLALLSSPSGGAVALTPQATTVLAATGGA